MDINQLKPIVEAMIFVSEEPITESNILLALSDLGLEKEDLRECIARIEKEWNESSDRGIGLSEVAGGYQFRTKAVCADWLRRLNVPKPMRLSGPALETLAIVAYKQPMVRSEIEKIRGVDSGGVLKTLLERRLLRIVGRRDEPGQPLLYGTTKEFLEIFNLNTLGELPTLKDIEELLRERRIKTDSVKNVDAMNPVEPDMDGEEPTEVMEDIDEEEEETEVIERCPLDSDEEAEKKDMEALYELDGSIRDLRRLERAIFPRPLPGIGGELQGGGDVASSIQGTGEAGPLPEAAQGAAYDPAPADETAGEDAASADDRTVE